MIGSLRTGGDSGRIPRLMRNLIAVCLSLGLLAVAACGSSNVQENSCTDMGGLCVKTGAACGDTLAEYTCPSGGICCSPTSQGSSDQPSAASEQPSTTPAVH